MVSGERQREVFTQLVASLFDKFPSLDIIFM